MITGARAVDRRVPEVSVLIDWATLIRDADGVCETSNGEHLPVSTVRRLCCDAEITTTDPPSTVNPPHGPPTAGPAPPHPDKPPEPASLRRGCARTGITTTDESQVELFSTGEVWAHQFRRL